MPSNHSYSISRYKMSFQCSGYMRNFLKELPKCEHHVHLEGTLGPELLFPLAHKNAVVLPDWYPKTAEELEQRYVKFNGLQDFLNYYYIGMSVLVTVEDFYELAMTYFRRAKSEGIWHAEVFFDPQGHTERGISMDVVVEGFQKACSQAESELGLTTKLIMCLLRHLPPDDCLRTIEDASKYYEAGIIHGLGLDSAEAPFPPSLFIDCYKSIRERFPEVLLTAHAGEDGGPEFVSDTLDILKATRIDHGTNSKRDPTLLKRLAKQQTLLTLCPISNWRGGFVNEITDLPMVEFLEYNIPFSINSDDPGYLSAYILDNYVKVYEAFGFDLSTWGRIAKNGIQGSRCDDDRKSEMEDAVDIVIKKYMSTIE